MDGAGYFDIQELENGNLAFVESNKLTVRYHEISVDFLDAMKRQLNPVLELIEQMPDLEGPVFNWNRAIQDTNLGHRAPGIFQLFWLEFLLADSNVRLKNFRMKFWFLKFSKKKRFFF